MLHMSCARDTISCRRYDRDTTFFVHVPSRAPVDTDIVTMKYKWRLTHAILKGVTSNMSDFEIFNDTRIARSLRQLSFLRYDTVVCI